MATFLLKSLGCKISQYDGERLAESLRQRGFIQVECSPDIFILNGCSVTGRASQKVRQIIRGAVRNWPNVKIVLSGCEARLAVRRNQEVPEADWLLTEYSDEYIDKMLSALAFDIQPENICIDTLPVTSRTRAFLKVQDGCNQFCSYCIVAHLRGSEWSRPISESIEEARRLVTEGHKEIVITGIHVGHFKPSLFELFKELEKIEGLERIRLSSIESVELNDELIEWFATSPKACQQIHLPLQSGCDTILRAMCRPYDTAGFRVVVDKIRLKMPFAAITTDLIVGFPGETEEYFQQTLDFIEDIGFSRIHIFKFSPRDGTPAATMANQIDNAVKKKRSDCMEVLWRTLAETYYNRFVGQNLEVLWETHENGILHGFSREYIPCFLKIGNTNMQNSISTVRGISSDSCGIVVSQS